MKPTPAEKAQHRDYAREESITNFCSATSEMLSTTLWSIADFFDFASSAMLLALDARPCNVSPSHSYSLNFQVESMCHRLAPFQSSPVSNAGILSSANFRFCTQHRRPSERPYDSTLQGQIWVHGLTPRINAQAKTGSTKLLLGCGTAAYQSA